MDENPGSAGEPLLAGVLDVLLTIVDSGVAIVDAGHCEGFGTTSR
jgi:hypothetical protein